VIAFGFAVFWLGTWGVGSAAAAGGGKLEILGGAEGRTVKLQACPAGGTEGSSRGCVRGTGPYAGGKLTVLVHNGGESPQTLAVSYRNANAEESLTSESAAAPGVFLLEGATPASLRIEAGKTVPLALGFEVENGEAPSAIDGTLLIEAAGTQPLVVPITGEFRIFAGVSVVPSTLTMDTAHRKATVLLEGPELAEYLQAYGGEEVPLTLFGPAGHVAHASVLLPGAQSVEAQTGGGRATATLTLRGHPGAGKYTGKLRLSGLPAESGALSVELNARKGFWVLVLFVLAGVVFIGFGTRLVTAGTRRKLLETVLEQTYDAFALMAQASGRVAWRLDDMLGDSPGTLSESEKKQQRKSRPANGRLQGLPALRYSIAHARSSKDLDEDAARVLDMVARMQRWLRVEPLARRLAKVEATRSGGAVVLPGESETDPALRWADSRTLRDTRALLKMAAREPENAEKADDLVARLMFQVDWHNRLATAWDASKSDEDRRREVRTLDEALGDDSQAEERKPAEQDGLAVRLDALIQKLPEQYRSPGVPDIGNEELSKEATSLGITSVEWKASAHLFTGWATLDEPSYGQLTRRVATSSRGLSTPNLSDMGREIALFKLPDLYWSLAIAAFASAAYAITAYNDTWGSGTDLATAFLAGSLGKVAINWAALPIFQSTRLRKTESG
jgi:hypothetical protein